MKVLAIILKTLLIGYLWSVIFIDGIRVLLLINWHFDLFLKEHWILLRQKWNSGAPISGSEIVFFIVIISSVPLWLAGWFGLCVVNWKKWLKYIIFSPLYLYRKLTLKTKAPVVIKKKSIKEEAVTAPKTPIIKKAPVKKPLPSATLMQNNINNNTMASPSFSSSMPSSAPHSSYSAPNKKKQEQSAPIDHALFNFDDDDFDLDFDFEKKDSKQEKTPEIPSALVVDEPVKKDTIEATVVEKTTKEAKPQKSNDKPKKDAKPPRPEPAGSKESHTPVLDVLKQKGYDVIPSAIIKNTTIDYIAVSKNQILLCLVDREVGDWLADEEKFNDEEPLWFSESSHRISPVRKLNLARDVMKTKLAVADFNFEIQSYVVIQSGNIINAEDMFDIWKSMDINVTRINRGSPKEIRLFSRAVENCEDRTDKTTIEKLKKLIYSMA